jgi:hypothetical protein
MAATYRPYCGDGALLRFVVCVLYEKRDPVEVIFLSVIATRNDEAISFRGNDTSS